MKHRVLTKCSCFSVGFHCEAGCISDNTLLKTWSIGPNTCFLHWTNLHLERALCNRLATVIHVHDIVTGFLWCINAFVGGRIKLAYTNSFFHSTRANDLDIEVTISSTLSMNLEISVITDTHPLGLNTTTSCITPSCIRSYTIKKSSIYIIA